MYGEIKQVFEVTRQWLLYDRLKLIGVAAEKQKVEGSENVLKADLWAERELVPPLCKLWHGVPVLCEEAEHSGLASLVLSELLPYADTVQDLPETLMSVDGLDGSALYSNGELGLVAMSAGLIREGRPVAGLVMTLDDGVLYSTNVLETDTSLDIDGAAVSALEQPKLPLKRCIIGVDDNRAVDADFRQQVISKLMGNAGVSYPVNVPSVVGAIKVLRSNIAAYVTSNARHWDIAGTAALCEAAGMVVRCLDGAPIPWTHVRMPPVIFARDEQTFEYVCSVIS